MLFLQLCPTLCNTMDPSLQASSVHGILQARILKWVALPSSRNLPDPGIKPTSLLSPAFAARFFPRASLVAQPVKNLPAMQEVQFQSMGWRILWKRAWLPTPFSCLENCMNREAWQSTVHRVARSLTWPTD